MKTALERKRGWPCEQQKLRLENGRDANDTQSLVSLRLHKQAFPTLQLQLIDPSSKRARTSFRVARAVEVRVEPEPLHEERAALEIQRITRGKHARQQHEDERLWLAVREMCAHTEMRSAVRIQRRFRQAAASICAAREVREVEAAGAIQRMHHSRQRRLNPKRNQAAWLREMLAEAESESQSECSTGREITTPFGETLAKRFEVTPKASPASPTVAFSAVETPAKEAQPRMQTFWLS